MKAAIVDAEGATPRYGEFPDPEPQEGETGMEVLAAGIHPVVRRLASGTHYGSDGAYPRVPGVDCVASGADGVARYAGFVRAPWGSLSERVAARMGVPIPAHSDPAVVAASLNPGMSSWMPLTTRLSEKGTLGTVLVVGATGVAGRIAVQNALALGADRVIGLGRDIDRLAEVGRLGGAPVALGEGAAGLQRGLGGASPSLILDFAWGAAAELVWDALEGRGLNEDEADILHVEIGDSAGTSARLPAALLRSRRMALQGSGAGSGSLTDILTQLPVFLEKVASGHITAPVRRFPLARIDEAWAYPGPDRAVVIP